MAEFSGPWTGEPLPDNRYQRLMHFLGGGAYGGGSAGVAINSGATGVTVQPFEAVYRGRYYRLDAPMTLTPAAPPSSLTRIDRLAVRFNPFSRSANLVIHQGSAGSNIPPALADSFEGSFDMPVCRVTVYPTAPTVRDLRYEARLAPLGVIACDARSRPGVNGTQPELWQPIYDVDLGRFLIWDGSQWSDPSQPSAVMWQWARATTGRTADLLGANGTRHLIGGTVTSAPAGRYLAHATAILRQPDNVTTVGYLQWRVGGVIASENRCDLDGLARPHTFTLPITHPGGNLNVAILFHPGSVGGQVLNNGTKVVLQWVGY